MRDQAAGRSVQQYYGEEDRERMCTFIRRTDKICLGFKILAASRNCTTRESTRQAFEYALRNIKKNDAIVVGMFYHEQVQENADFVKEIWKEITSA